MIFCCQEEEEKKKNRKQVRLTFKRKELIYDVSNYSFVVSDVLPEDAEHARHQIADIAQDGNIDRVTRVLNLAHAEVVEALYPYTKNDVICGTSLDDVLQEPEEYTIALSVPSDFSSTTVNLLEHLIHEYLVYMVLWDWLGITLPASASVWEDKLHALKKKLRSLLMSRTGRIRRKMKPW